MSNSLAKSQILGVNFGTARHRLDRDIMFKLAVEAGYACFRCGQPLTRETFNVEHKTIWATAQNPLTAFFDLDNIAFSHHRCNAVHTSRRKYENKEESYAAHLVQSKNRRRNNYDPAQRSERYRNTGW